MGLACSLYKNLRLKHSSGAAGEERWPSIRNTPRNLPHWSVGVLFRALSQRDVVFLLSDRRKPPGECDGTASCARAA